MLKNGKKALVTAAEIKKDTKSNIRLLESMEEKTNKSIKMFVNGVTVDELYQILQL